MGGLPGERQVAVLGEAVRDAADVVGETERLVDLATPGHGPAPPGVAR
jgi:hypothetical protein